MTTIDLNCDLGEGFGPWEMGNDAAMIELATSVNIACGFLIFLAMLGAMMIPSSFQLSKSADDQSRTPGDGPICSK